MAVTWTLPVTVTAYFTINVALSISNKLALQQVGSSRHSDSSHVLNAYPVSLSLGPHNPAFNLYNHRLPISPIDRPLQPDTPHVSRAHHAPAILDALHAQYCCFVSVTLDYLACPPPGTPLNRTNCYGPDSVASLRQAVRSTCLS